MSFDEQMFRQDGTLLTRIDIAILKFARLFTAYFLKEDEETLLPAAKRVLKTTWYVLGGAAAIEMLAGNTVGSVATIMLLLLYVFMRQGRPFRLSGMGTNIPQFAKAVFVGLLFFIPIIDFMPPYPGGLSSIALVVRASGIVLYLFTIGFISRLGDKPPRKKKKVRVKAPKLALSPTQ